MTRQTETYIFRFMLFLGLGCVSIGIAKEFISINDKLNAIQSDTRHIGAMVQKEEAINDSILYDYLLSINIMYPDIVLAQAKLESGNYTSNIYKSNKNLFGMKIASKRATLGKTAKEINQLDNGIDNRNKNGHAHYLSWESSVLDYALFQMRFCGKMSREQYLTYLGKNYASIPDYRKRLEHTLKTVK